MTPDKYMEATARTWRTDVDLDLQLCNAAMGLVGEVGELHADTTACELGDVWYYLATLCRIYDVSLHTWTYGPDDFEETLARTWRTAAEVAELNKKIIFHEQHHLRSELCIELSNMASALNDIGGLLGLSTPDVWRQNIDKLRARYPDGFEVGGGVR